MFKKLKHYLIKTLGLRGSWKWAKKQMMFEGIIKRERITKEEDPTDNYMVLSHDFSIQEQQYDYSVNDINFPVIWYNNLTTYLSAYYEPDVDLENNKKY